MRMPPLVKLGKGELHPFMSLELGITVYRLGWMRSEEMMRADDSSLSMDISYCISPVVVHKA